MRLCEYREYDQSDTAVQSTSILGIRTPTYTTIALLKPCAQKSNTGFGICVQTNGLRFAYTYTLYSPITLASGEVMEAGISFRDSWSYKSMSQPTEMKRTALQEI